MSVEANSLKCRSICARPKNEMSSGGYTNEWIIHIKENMEVKKKTSWKKSSPLWGCATEIYFSKCACPNALDRSLLGLGHDIPNLSSNPLGNQSGFMIIPHCKVNLSWNVSLQKITLWANTIGMEMQNGMHIRKWRRWNAKSYLVKEFDEDICGESVPSRATLLNLLACLVVSRRDEILERR